MADYKMKPNYAAVGQSAEAYATMVVAERVEELVGVLECMAHELERIAETLKRR